MGEFVDCIGAVGEESVRRRGRGGGAGGVFCRYSLRGSMAGGTSKIRIENYNL